MIDVHVLTYEGTNPVWLDHCLTSLHGEECTVHVVDNKGKTHGQGRADGYALGTHPYVSHVDCDDWVYPGVMAAVIDGLQNAQSVVTMENVLHNGKTFFRGPRKGHHLFAARREAVTPYLDKIADTPLLADVLLRQYLKPVQLEFIGYAWRLHDRQTHRKLTREMMTEAQKRWAV